MNYKKQIVPLVFGSKHNEKVILLEACVYNGYAIHKEILTFDNTGISYSDKYVITEIETGYKLNTFFIKMSYAKQFIDELVQYLKDNSIVQFYEQFDDLTFKIKPEFEVTLMRFMLRYKNNWQLNIFDS